MWKRASKKISLSATFIILLATPRVMAQTTPVDSLAQMRDEAALLEDSERSAYEIARLRLQRELLKKRTFADPAILKNAEELLREAESFSREGDYVTALVLLETALDLTATSAPLAAQDFASSSSPTSASPKMHWQWQREALAGVDLSRLEFELGNEDDDAFFAELQQRSVQNNANPFVGTRVDLTRAGIAPWEMRAFSLLKASAEYYNAALDFSAQSRAGQATNWRAENRWEGTSYRDTSGLRYWQNTSVLQGGVKLSKDFRLEVGEEFRLRQYRGEAPFSPNYRHNEIGMRATYVGGFSTRVQALYEYGVRTHPSSPRDDYIEHRLEASLAQHSYESASVYLQNIWRRRLYPLGIPDSTFQNTYREEYLRADLTLNLTPRTSIRVEGDLTLRQYETPSVFTPDFFNAKINPKVQIKLWQDWQASVGYIFLVQVNGTQAQGATNEELASGFYEDYYANGFTLGLDLFSAKGLLLSASHMFEARIYPDSQFDQTAVFNPNPNRNNNSFLLFLSWQITPSWQLSGIANFDSQISRAEYREDLRNTIFSVELGYAF